MLSQKSFITVPTVDLPGGVTVPGFRVGKFLCGQVEQGIAVVSANIVPWVYLDYYEAVAACSAINAHLISELQYLALAYDVCTQDINWTEGKVGAGTVFQGLHLNSVHSALPASVSPPDPLERRWHQLSNGERIFDLAGNACSWVFDDVQGDASGLQVHMLENDSPSICTAPYPSTEMGMGWFPMPWRDWSGYAIIRAGNWHDMNDAGIFALGYLSPDVRTPDIGFRCTIPINHAAEQRSMCNAGEKAATKLDSNKVQHA